MWIKEYHRNLLSEGQDNSEFGEICPVTSLTEFESKAPFIRHINVLPPQSMPGVNLYGAQGKMEDRPNFMQPCIASFRYAYNDPITATIFLPDHTIFAGDVDGGILIEESFWHNYLWYSKWFRCDRSTGWKFRVARTWQEQHIVKEQTNFAYHRYHFQYFHWFMDCLSHVWLLKSQSLSSKSDKWFIGPLDQKFHAPSLALFDILPDDCIWFPEHCVVKFDQLVFSQFKFEEPLKTLRPDFSSGVYNVGWSNPYFSEVRDRAYRKYRINNGKPRDLLYVGRGDSAHRRIRNEAEVVTILEAHGFITVNPGTLPFQEQVEIFARARGIVAIHGAGLTNILWAQPGCTILEFMPEGLGDVGYRFTSNIVGHNHASILCKSFDHPSGLAYADIEVDIAALHSAMADLF